MLDRNYDKIVTIELIDEQESERIAHHLAQWVQPGLLMTFSGEIGAGKTTIIRALLKKLGVTSAIKSPTFSLVESYHVKDLYIHHFDLYRIQHEEELEYLGFRDYFCAQSVCLIEWAEHARNTLPKVDVRFNLSINGAGRLMQLQAGSATGENILACLTGGL